MSRTSQYAAKGKGKYSSPETVWSRWEWNSAGYLESHRINASGATEYRTDLPLNQAAGNDTTPRSSGVFDDQYIVDSGWNPISTSEEHYSGMPAAIHDYLTSTDSGQTPYVAPDYSNWVTPAHPGGYEQNLSDTYEQSQTGGHYQQASSNYSAPAYYDSPAHSNAHISYSGPQEQDYLDATSAFSGLSLTDPKPNDLHPKIIHREPGSQDYESLDPRYCVVPSKESKWFWKFGRVFMMLWTEPGGHQVPPGGGTRNGSHMSTAWLNESEYSEIRRFVVVQEYHDYVLCLPVQTYSEQATLKPNLPDPQQHAIIYTSRHCPDEWSEVTGVGQEYYEELTKDPIRVISEQKGPEGTLSPFSRINYSKTYSVGKDVRVLNIGMVSGESLPSLQANSPLKQKWNSQTSKRGRSDFHRRKGNSRAKGKNSSWRRYETDMDYPIGPIEEAELRPMFSRESNVGIGSSSEKPNDRMDTGQRSTGLVNSLAGYQVIGFPSRFFKKGRVFKALWTEPAGDVTNSEDAFVIPSRYGENAFTKIRHFVVAREKQGCCLCLMLNTYHRQGASKDGIKAENYAAVYPLGGEPEVGPNENMTKEPFPIKVEEAGESIDPTSRIDFGRVYTVEHNIKVLKVGRIPNDFLPRLEEYFVNSIVGP